MDIHHLQKPDKVIFLDDTQIKKSLHAMVEDERFDTSPTTKLNSDNMEVVISFFDKHWTYLKTHPKVNPSPYITNLRTMTKIRHP